MASDTLPTWPEISGHALGHLDTARNEASKATDWLRGIASRAALTPAEARAAREALKLAGRAKNLLDEAKGVLYA